MEIRNFVIIAHIDHGKSTLADRFLEVTHTVSDRQMKPQYLDQLDLERERGITIKMAPVRMIYYSDRIIDRKYLAVHEASQRPEVKSRIPDSKQGFVLNLIDTPGHSDFSYEVSRALAAVEGAVLLVDSVQGIQAQTLANYETAKKAGLIIIGAVNKIDMATPERVESSVSELAGLLSTIPERISRVSGKTGEGVDDLLERIVRDIPAPHAEVMNGAVSRALVFDSFYDEHKGVIAYVRVFNGAFHTNASGLLHATHVKFSVKELGSLSPGFTPAEILQEGEIGYIATGIKNPEKLKIGDTFLMGAEEFKGDRSQLPLSGYAEPKPVVFVSFYPEESYQYDELKKALEKLHLTDSALTYDADSSEVLGRGFKVGFLGRLHFEITAERLSHEFSIMTTHSFPSVAYKVCADKCDQKSSWRTVTNPREFPDNRTSVQEPMTRVEILTPIQFLSGVLGLKQFFRFSDINTEMIGKKILIKAKLPLAELIHDLDDKLKSISEGFASLNYELIGYEHADVQKLEILIAGHNVPGLTRILPRGDLEREGRRTVRKLKSLLPKEQFSQALQACVGGTILARETIPAMKKNVTGNLYGGDRTRKMKLWKKQQKGKQRLKEQATGRKISIPAGVFRELLKK